MRWVTLYGVPLLVLAVVPLWWMSSHRSSQRHTAISAALAFLCGLGINQAILLFIQRPRPYTTGLTHLLIAPSVDPSFPSDHATAACAIAATFLLKGRHWLALPFSLAALVVMISRVYVGTHYVGDVVGGMVTAIVGAWLVNRYYPEDCWLNRRLIRLL